MQRKIPILIVILGSVFTYACSKKSGSTDYITEYQTEINAVIDSLNLYYDQAIVLSEADSFSNYEVLSHVAHIIRLKKSIDDLTSNFNKTAKKNGLSEEEYYELLDPTIDRIHKLQDKHEKVQEFTKN